MLRTELIQPLSALLSEHASRRAGKIAFRDRWRSVTYGELELRTRRLGVHLGTLTDPGDRVLILLGNRVEAVESCLAGTRANCVSVPVNPHSSEGELAWVLGDSAAKVVITDSANLSRVLDLAPGVRVVVVDRVKADGGSVFAYDDVVGQDQEAPLRDDQGLDEVAFLLYTSGATGNQKGVACTQRSCLWSVAACYAPVVGLSEKDDVLWSLPLHHSLGHVLCVVGVTATGATASLLDSPTSHELLAELDRGDHTFLAGVPATYHQLVRAARTAGPRRSTLTRCLTAGSSCPADLTEAVEALFGVPLLDGYGSTETCGLITVNWLHGTRVPGSCGLPVPGLTVRLVDPGTALDVPAGAEGEVWVRGPNLMHGYHNQPEATAAAMPGGWFRTGDLARQDEAGYLMITGRLGDVIIRSGENIHPGAVEHVLAGVEGIADAAVVGKPHDVLGEVPIAFVVPAAEGLDTSAVFDACHRLLPRHQVPEELYEVDAIPRTSTGKITRRVLLDLPARPRGGRHESLMRTRWTPLPSVRTTGVRAPRRWAVVGADVFGLAGLLATEADVVVCPDMAALHEVAAAGGAVPEVVVLCCPDDVPVASELTRTAERTLRRVRTVLSRWSEDDSLAGPRLLLLTRGAVSTDGHPARDLVHAPVWGLVSERRPGVASLIDVDHHPSSLRKLLSLAGINEPKIAVREGTALVPVSQRIAAPFAALGSWIDPEGTVLVTGAPGVLGSAVARHLVTAHGARHFLLSVGENQGAIGAELVAMGAQVTVVDDGLAETLNGLARPVTAVVHSIPEDSTAPFLSTVDSVVDVHRLTASRELGAFVVLHQSGGPDGAAAAAFLDALAAERRGRGLPATVLTAGGADGAQGPSPSEFAGLVDVAVWALR